MPKGIVGAGSPFKSKNRDFKEVKIPVTKHLTQLAALAGVSPEEFVNDAVGVYSKLLKERVQGATFFKDDTPYMVPSLERAASSLQKDQI